MPAKRIQAYSQPLALKELAVILAHAERGEFDKVQELIVGSDSPLGADFIRQPGDARLLEAVLVLASIYKGTGRSMSGYVQKLATDFTTMHARAAGIHIPKPLS